MNTTVDNENTIVIGSRKSQLALVQTYWVKKELENMAIQVAYKIRDIEEEAKDALLDLEYKVGKYVVDPHIEGLLEKYGKFDKIDKNMTKARCQPKHFQ